MIATSIALSLTLLGSSANVVSTRCEAPDLLIRQVTIEDAGGRYDGQDVLIENGIIAAMASEIEVSSSIPELSGAGFVLRRAQPEIPTLVIQAAARQAEATGYILPGQRTDLVLTDAHGYVPLEIRDGRLVGPGTRCLDG
ncbi:hypothetical protein RMQ97_11950 [Maricaulis sp. D1M11]|uniref:hypothetical protein n=1 Tax=Maricaulis sp. D1M11 TaxID=3076117 RepID=UPI0039B5C140